MILSSTLSAGTVYDLSPWLGVYRAARGQTDGQTSAAAGPDCGRWIADDDDHQSVHSRGPDVGPSVSQRLSIHRGPGIAAPDCRRVPGRAGPGRRTVPSTGRRTSRAGLSARQHLSPVTVNSALEKRGYSTIVRHNYWSSKRQCCGRTKRIERCCWVVRCWGCLLQRCGVGRHVNQERMRRQQERRWTTRYSTVGMFLSSPAAVYRKALTDIGEVGGKFDDILYLYEIVGNNAMAIMERRLNAGK